MQNLPTRFPYGGRIMVRGRNLTDRIDTQPVSNAAGWLEPGRAVGVTVIARLTG